MSLARTYDRQELSGGPPSWSGIPIYEGGPEMMVPIHIDDERQFGFPGWEHVSIQETEGGEVEYHIYRRDDR